MSRAIHDATACREALSRLPELDLSELRQHWRALYKADASPHLSRELLLRAVAYRMQEVDLGGLRPQRQRQLRQVAQQLKQTGAANTRPRAELKAGTRLVSMAASPGRTRTTARCRPWRERSPVRRGRGRSSSD